METRVRRADFRSTDRYALKAHDNLLDDDTLVAVRRVKHALVKDEGATGFELTSLLRTSAKPSWQHYQNDLLRKRSYGLRAQMVRKN